MKEIFSSCGTGETISYNGASWPERVVDVTLKTIIEFREEMRGFRDETRRTLAQHSHRLNIIEATVASLKVDAGVLLSAVPVSNERLDNLEARVAALEARGE